MKKSVLIVVVYLFSVFAFGQGSHKDLIKWSESVKLDWKDFKAKPNKATKALAQTQSHVLFKFQQSSNSEAEVELQSYFNTAGSWVKVETEYLLNHEQIHADITEVFARKIRKEITNNSGKLGKNFDKKLQEIYNRNMQELNKFQRLYDKETNHSINKSEQERWNKKVNKLLLQLEYYSNAKINIKI